MSITAKDLSRIEDAITTAKDTASKAEGAIEQLDKDLKDSFGISSPDEVPVEIEKLETQIKALDRRIETEEDVLRAGCQAAGIVL